MFWNPNTILFSCCSLYRDIRIKYHLNVSFPSLYKFGRLMSSKNSRTIRNIGKFVHYALLARQEKLDNLPAS